MPNKRVFEYEPMPGYFNTLQDGTKDFTAGIIRFFNKLDAHACGTWTASRETGATSF